MLCFHHAVLEVEYIIATCEKRGGRLGKRGSTRSQSVIIAESPGVRHKNVHNQLSPSSHP